MQNKRHQWWEAVKMLFGLLKRKDPICGMKEEKGNGLEFDSKWFCSENCKKQYEVNPKAENKEHKHGGCCCH